MANPAAHADAEKDYQIGLCITGVPPPRISLKQFLRSFTINILSKVCHLMTFRKKPNSTKLGQISFVEKKPKKSNLNNIFNGTLSISMPYLFFYKSSTSRNNPNNLFKLKQILSFLCTR
jgi:hypothetical protein